jgi:tetratricopeptide (TPR) repeat protein
MQQSGNFVFVFASASALADILIVLGLLPEAEKTYQQALQLASKHGKDAQQITAHHYLGLAMLAHEKGEDAATAEQMEKARELGEQTTLVDWSYRWHHAQARLNESGGNLEAALAQLDEAGGAYVKTPIPDARPIEALKANVYLKQGMLAKAQDWVHARGLSAEDEINYLGEFEHLTLARVLMAEVQGRQSLGKVPLHLMGESLHHQDFKDTAGPSLRFCCFQQALQQSDSLEDRVIAPLALVFGDQHPGQNEMLELAQVADFIVSLQPPHLRPFLGPGQPALLEIHV